MICLPNTPLLPDLELSDSQLIDLTCQGNQIAFERLVLRYSPPIFNYVYHLMGDKDLAEDLSQDIFLRAYMMLPRLDIERPFKPWLFRVAHNCCIDELRRRNRRAIPFSHLILDDDDTEEALINTIIDPDPLPDEQAVHHDLQHILREAILALPIKYRSVIALRYGSQLGFAEIGTILNMPEATAKTYFARSKGLLRTLLQDKEL
jgi:RNA polymerase sigma-70 factor (ECF subfamily)